MPKKLVRKRNKKIKDGEKKKKMVCEDKYMRKVKRMFARIKTGGGKDKILFAKIQRYENIRVG